MEIKIYGPGCAKCQATWRVAQKVVDEAGRDDVQLTKVTDMEQLLAAGILTTPAVVVDGVVRIKGHVPSEKELKEVLGW
ncbi:MAG TPA: TM0996/MTH895 family glutaredoxin-like protein [Candidatus Rikenella faecigallinarum]|uniref:TM0996/MTH895 family glutaredoxin-like protein n=1 Tax=Candidatus Rikenella faecigallinarum TaxID=2838745 RepID=A0A9D1QFR2_9BACT|nr:TM0996/MTH895 family glutaredoxin-like protein [Candidatus Rikenella faecigallinarum]